VLSKCEPLGGCGSAAIGAGRNRAAGLRNALHLVVADAAATMQRIKQYLVNDGIAVSRMRSPAQFEDVFVSSQPRAMPERSANHELDPPARRGQKGSSSDRPRCAQPDDCGHYPVTLMLLFGYGVNLDLKGLPIYGSTATAASRARIC